MIREIPQYIIRATHEFPDGSLRLRRAQTLFKNYLAQRAFAVAVERDDAGIPQTMQALPKYERPSARPLGLGFRKQIIKFIP